jgi:hypothetical protein
MLDWSVTAGVTEGWSDWNALWALHRKGSDNREARCEYPLHTRMHPFPSNILKRVRARCPEGSGSFVVPLNMKQFLFLIKTSKDRLASLSPEQMQRHADARTAMKR